MSECHCYCHRSYDYCDGKCCERNEENNKKDRDFRNSPEGKQIELEAHIEVLGYYGVNNKTIKEIKKMVGITK